MRPFCTACAAQVLAETRNATVILRCGCCDDLGALFNAEAFRTSTTALGIVDGWGRPFEWARALSRRDVPAVKSLCSSFPGRVLVSVGVRHKTQLAQYGGYGYDFATTLGLPTRCLGDAKGAVAWAQKPKKQKVDTVTLRCTLCNASFEVKRGDHYGKFDFVYCGRSCLSDHRASDFNAARLTGPTASAQDV